MFPKTILYIKGCVLQQCTIGLFEKVTGSFTLKVLSGNLLDSIQRIFNGDWKGHIRPDSEFCLRIKILKISNSKKSEVRLCRLFSSLTYSRLLFWWVGGGGGGLRVLSSIILTSNVKFPYPNVCSIVLQTTVQPSYFKE